MFSNDELIHWAKDRRAQLVLRVRYVSTLALAVLDAARATPWRMLALSAREIWDPDQRSGFLSHVSIIVRTCDHRLGRLGAWEENGALCIEAELSEGAALVVNGSRADICMDQAIPDTLLAASIGRPVSEVVHHPLLSGIRSPILAVAGHSERGHSVLSFEADRQNFSFAALKPPRGVGRRPDATTRLP